MSILSNIGAYFESLIPAFKKRDILIDTEHTFEELNLTVQPMYTLAEMPAFSGKTYENAEAFFRKKIHTYRDSPIKTVAQALVIILDNQDDITIMINKEFKDVNLKQITDYHQLNILKYVESLTFFSDYARMLMNVVVWESLRAELTRTNPEVASNLAKSPTLKRDSEFVNNFDNLEAFAIVVNMLAMPLAKFLDGIKDLKGHTYSPDDWNGTSNPVTNKLDPFQANLIPVQFNPIYHFVQLPLNVWRVKRHERNKAELNRIQFMLLELSQEKTAGANPQRGEQIEKSIAYYSNLANKLSAEIERMEER